MDFAFSLTNHQHHILPEASIPSIKQDPASLITALDDQLNDIVHVSSTFPDRHARQELVRLLDIGRDAPDLLDRLPRERRQPAAAQQAFPAFLRRLSDVQPKQKLDDVLVRSLSRCGVERLAIAREGVEQGEHGEKVDFIFERSESEGEGDAVLVFEAVKGCLWDGGEEVINGGGVDLGGV